MEFFSIQFSEVAEKLDLDALSDAQRNTLFQGLKPAPGSHDVFRIMLAIREIEPKDNWNERQRKRKLFSLVDRALIDLRPSNKSIRIVGLHPGSLPADGTPQMDLEAQTGFKIMDVANASLKFTGPIKNWWRKKRPLIVANRTDRLVQWVFSREWIDQGNQCQGEILCIVPKGLSESERKISCYADFKEKRGRAIEKARRTVPLPA